MNNYYTYAYLREDGTPYYIGKGKGNRAFDKNRKGFKPPKDKSRIILLKQNLTEREAFKHEIYMISILGRKDLGTGILYNRTNGGEGSSGIVISNETREKMSKSRIGEKHPFYNKTHSNETREKMSKSQIGKTLSAETREKMSISKIGENNVNSYWWKLTFIDGNEVTICGLRNWAYENSYTYGNIHQVYLGKRKRHKDIVTVQKLAHNT